MSEQRLYKILSLKQYDIVIPFVCNYCDECKRLFQKATHWDGADENCPGYREFRKVYNGLHRRDSELRDPKDYPIESIRPVPDHRWLIIWTKFIKTNPSEAMILKFTELNNVRDQYVRPYLKSQQRIGSWRGDR